MDAWIARLKQVYDAGYYRTEAAVGEQTAFPWQNKTCKDCPFWASSVCQVHAEYRAAYAHTCIYFDAGNRAQAQTRIRERQADWIQRWREWLNEQR